MGLGTQFGQHMSELLLKEEGRGNVIAMKDTGCPPKMPEWIFGYYSTLSCAINKSKGSLENYMKIAFQ